MGYERERRLAVDPKERGFVDELVEQVLDEHRALPPGKATLVEELFAERLAKTTSSGLAVGRQTLLGRDDRLPVPAPHAPITDPALPSPPGPGSAFEDFRSRGLHEVLTALSSMRCGRGLIEATLSTARRITRPEPTSLTVRPSPPDPAGQAMWRAAERRAATLYRRAVDGGDIKTEDPAVEMALARAGGGQPLPAAVRRKMELELDISLDRVRIHTDAVAADATRAVRAEAFTVGEDIFFAEGAYAPETAAGQQLLAHELTHVAQARRGRAEDRGPGIQVSSPDESLEREADATAGRIAELVASDSGEPLPFLDVIQSSFGHHDISYVRAHASSVAADAARRLDARAFAFRDHVAFAGTPDLHTAAHEAAHVVQQRAGVALADGLDRPGDAYEQHADGVADAVVRGESAEPLLDQMAGRGGTPATRTVQRKSGNAAQAAANDQVTPQPPSVVIDLHGSSPFSALQELAAYIKQAKDRGAEIRVKFGTISKAGGLIRIATRDGKRFRTVGPSAIPIDHEFLSGRFEKLDPHLQIQISNNTIRGWATPGKKDEGDHALGRLIAKSGPAFGLTGFDLTPLHFQNEITGGVFKFGTKKDTEVKLAGWVTLKLGMGLDDGTPRLHARGDVKVRGLGNGLLEITRKGGVVTGAVEMPVQLANFSGKVMATYKDGELSIAGTLSYETEKLRGSVTVVVMEAAEAEKAARAQIDPENLATETTRDAQAPNKPEKPRKGERGIAGWGELDFAFTDWFTGRAKAIFGPAGYVTIIGKIAPPKSVELMEERPYSTHLFGAHPTARYGLPYVADIHVGIGVDLGATARLGPAVLTNLAVEGVYSTDPKVLNAFSITGALQVSAYAGLNLRFEGKAGFSIADHDVEFGAALTGTAGIKGYAGAQATLGYREKEDPVAGKKGEYFLKGHLEIAAQPFLGLAGELFVRLDSPCWSPAPDKTWPWPLFSLEYPLPGEFGIGVDIDYVIGSKKWPEIQWGNAAFDASQFTDSLLDRKIPGKKSGGDVEKPGVWKGEAPPPPTAPPAPAPSSGKAPGAVAPKAGTPADKAAKGGQEPEEARNVPKTPDSSKRWLEGMKALGELQKRAEKDPETEEEIRTHLAEIKQRFGFTRLEPHLEGEYWVIDAALNSDGKDSKKPKPRVRAEGGTTPPQPHPQPPQATPPQTDPRSAGAPESSSMPEVSRSTVGTRRQQERLWEQRKRELQIDPAKKAKQEEKAWARKEGQEAADRATLAELEKREAEAAKKAEEKAAKKAEAAATKKPRKPNQPNREKWEKKGGAVVDQPDGARTYRNKDGIEVTYGPDMYPDFTPYRHPTVKDVEIEYTGSYAKDFKAANEKAGLGHLGSEPPEGYTWHHHQDGKTMQLIDYDVHAEFSHMGGMSGK